jgi:hypothetical protein
MLNQGVFNMSNTYNPLKREEIPQGTLGRTFTSDPNTTLVFSGKGRDLLVVRQGEKGPTMVEYMRGDYNIVYKVDISEKSLQFQCDLPCRTDAFNFYAEVQFNCSVNNPKMIVEKNITDALQRLKPLITNVMRNKSRVYDVGESGIAEKEISMEIKRIVDDSGFAIRNITLKLKLSEEAAQHIRKLLQLEREIDLDRVRNEQEIQQREFSKAQEEDDFIIQRNRKKASSDLETELEIEKANKDLKIKQIEIEAKQLEFSRQQKNKKIESDSELDLEIEIAERALKLERLKAAKRMIELEAVQNSLIIEQSIEEKRLDSQLRIMGKKMDFYMPMIQAGDWQLLALTLAQNSGDVHFVMSEINKQKENDRLSWMKAVEMLIDNDALEGHELEPIARQMLQGMFTVMKQNTLGLVGENNAGVLQESKEKDNLENKAETIEAIADGVDTTKGSYEKNIFDKK